MTVEDNSKWMKLGVREDGSQMCRREFGEVVAIYFDVVVKDGRFAYNGLDFVQYRDPRSLIKAWKYNHIKEK
eukprot:8273611-Karenia_brevis.AAC.1